MPAALQCPDCGHQEMLDNLGAGVTTFRCGGCGRALKVPAQFRSDPDARTAAPGSPGARPPLPGDRTQAMPTVPPVLPVGPAVGPLAGSSVGPPLVGSGIGAPLLDGPPTGRVPLTGAGAAGADVAPGSGLPPLHEPAPLTPEALRPPLILRLVLWVIALPLGSLIVFVGASAFHVLTKSQLEDTFLLAGWGRFLPIARLLPFCALATAALVQLGVFALERRRAATLRARSGPNGPRGGPGGGRGGRGPRPRRPLTPGGPAQRATNGDRSRDRVIS